MRMNSTEAVWPPAGLRLWHGILDFMSKSGLQGASASMDEKPREKWRAPKIYYATRTHSQIAQVFANPQTGCTCIHMLNSGVKLMSNMADHTDARVLRTAGHSYSVRTDCHAEHSGPRANSLQVVRELKRSTYRPKMAILVCFSFWLA